MLSLFLLIILSGTFRAASGRVRGVHSAVARGPSPTALDFSLRDGIIFNNFYLLYLPRFTYISVPPHLCRLTLLFCRCALLSFHS